MNLTIDNKPITVDKPITILDAAQQNNIYIPNLCAHPALTPYGGCRLCLVEIEGRRGYPTACTTMIEDGMVVRTNTKILQEMRVEMIQLILSEHPAACLMCDDIEGCSGYQETIRKVGVTTGCRWCPKDKDCELQRIVENLKIKELTLPGLYRDLPLEKYDPFFDRDYNLCIYCGRCVRICNEYRKSSVLSLRQRGKLTTIGPAFDLTHIDADCEFCGACVSVCPTGAMSEKSRKWWGLPEKYSPSVCPLCSMNCDIQVLTMKDKIVGTLPPGKPHESGGELCVKGRFCLSEIVNRTERILEPQYRYPEGCGIVSWDFAIEKTLEIVKDIQPSRSAMFLSPDLTLEEISAAKLFSEKVLQTSEITSSTIDDRLAAFMELAQRSMKFEDLKKASCIVSVFTNGNYSFSPLTLAVKNYASDGVLYYQIGWIKDTTTRFAQKQIIPTQGKEVEFFNQIVSFIEKGRTSNPEIKEFVKILNNSSNSVIILGPDIISLSRCNELIEIIKKIVRLTKSKVFIPNQYGNLNGLLSSIKMKGFADVRKKIEEGKIDLIYIIGDAAFKTRPNVKYCIYQSPFPPPDGLNPDIILPSSLWGEIGGSYINSEGTIKKFESVAIPHGYSRYNVEILRRISDSIKKKERKISQKEILQNIPREMKIIKPLLKIKNNGEIKVKLPDDEFPFLLIQEKNPHSYNNLDLCEGIDGFNSLTKTGYVMINPNDAKKLDLKHSDTVQIKSQNCTKSYRVTIRKNIAAGHLYLTTGNGSIEFETNPCPVNLRRDNV